MPSDYKSIRIENEHRYGTDIGRIGELIFSNLYEDRTHFIFELLQNADDALARRKNWNGPRTVSFDLSETQLRFSHFGEPFSEADVRGICGIAVSTKEIADIGRFGIGFKSVYAITNRPEVYSGREAFAIEKFVHPVEIERITKKDDETLFVFPFKQDDLSAFDDITKGLSRLGTTTLLFLRQIEEVRWSIEGGSSRTFLRKSQDAAPGVRRVTITGQTHDNGEVNDEWLIFSRAVAQNGRHVGFVEIAFSLTNGPSEGVHIQRVERSPLFVFFPTIVETHLGFILQGPYLPTPSRDNIKNDPWNHYLVEESGRLLADALRWLRDRELLDTATLRCLPIDPSKFGKDSMFMPLFQMTREKLLSEPLIPRFGGGYVSTERARLGRTQELRDLFNPSQLATLLGEDGEIFWISGDISQDRTPELRRYLMQELDVAEITPETIITRFNKAFLEAQPDDWILRLYEFLNGQSALHRRLEDGVPLIRLEDGSHVLPQVDNQPQAFLPCATATGFPTVRASVCATETALKFLRSLGLTEPDPVDDVVRNILPKYRDEVVVTDSEYEEDIRRIVAAFGTDSKAQREKLIAALRESSFVRAIDTGNESKVICKPDEVYQATERLKELFAGVKGVFIVDDTYTCLHGKNIHELLQACRVARYLQPVPIENHFSEDEKREIRRRAGLERASWEYPIKDKTLRGLDKVLQLLPQLEPEVRRRKAALLWEALVDVTNSHGQSTFEGEYTWGYSYDCKTACFDAAFVRQLNKTPWIPDEGGVLQRPEFVLFDSLGWKENPILLSKIRFKPPTIEILAKEAGIEPGVLDLLKKHGVVSVDELVARLGLNEKSQPEDNIVIDKPKDNADKSVESETTIGVEESRGNIGRESYVASKYGERTVPTYDSAVKEAGTTSKSKPATFISYVEVHPDNGEQDPDALEYQARMKLEEEAIDFILSREPEWRRTPANNPGYDLYLSDEEGNVVKWYEVKAMNGSLYDRPVGLSRTQFDFAREHGEAYWLYVVEYAGTDAARLVRIQDPAGRAQTFTFDYGWIAVAKLDDTGN